MGKEQVVVTIHHPYPTEGGASWQPSDERDKGIAEAMAEERSIGLGASAARLAGEGEVNCYKLYAKQAL